MSDSNKARIRCKYWEKCFRKSTVHLSTYLHPSDLKGPNTTTPNSSTTTPNRVITAATRSPKVVPNKHATTPSRAVAVSAATTPTRSPKVAPATTPMRKYQIGSVSVPHITPTRTAKRPGFSGNSEESCSSKAPVQNSEAVSRKRRKLSESINHSRYYFTKVVGHPDKFTEGIALNFRDILRLDGKVLKTWQFTFIVDLDWLLEEYPDNAAEGPIFLILGDAQAQEVQEQITQAKKSTSHSTKYSRVIVVPVNLPLAYGTHHTKMMIIQSEGGMRVVIHTANLVMGDWTVKTQGVWISPLCPKCDMDNNTSDLDTDFTFKPHNDLPDPDCMTFKPYLIEYLKSYKLSATNQLSRILLGYDMSHVTQVKLVGSVPGVHSGAMFGTPRLQNILSNFVDDTKVRPGWRVVANCSSIGTLGDSQADWLDGFIRVLQTTNKAPSHQVTPPCQSPGTPSTATPARQALFQLVYPTVDIIRNSLEGYCGGGSVPYNLQRHRRQPWLRGSMCNWDSKEYGRSRVVPHIKTYARISPDMKRLAWLLLTSSNLSKAAWGQHINNGQLRIRSYELGVVFVNRDTVPVYDRSRDEGVMVPYTLPPRPYSKTDKPWIADVAYNQLDTHGNKWPLGDD